MDTITSRLRLFLGTSLFTLITGCGGEGNHQNEDALVTIQAPSFAHAGEPLFIELEFAPDVEPFLVSINNRYVSDITAPIELTLHPPSDLTESDCCEVFVTFIDQREGLNHEVSLMVPTFGPTLYLGAPMTVSAQREVALLAGVDTGYLTYQNETVAGITWRQTAGPALALDKVTEDGRRLLLELPELDDIERFVFEATLLSSAGVSFTEEKILFAVPETEWVAATQVVQSEDRTMVLRADGTLAHLERRTASPEQLAYSQAPVSKVKKISVGPDVRDFLLDEEGQVFYRGRSQPEWVLLNPEEAIIRDFQAIQSDLRTGLNLITDNDDAYSSSSTEIDLGASPPLTSNASKITPSLSRVHVLKTNGELWHYNLSGEGTYIDNIRDLDLSAYLTVDGRVHSLQDYQPLSGFEVYDDIARITSSNLARATQYVFAWRENGELVANARLPLVEGVAQISSGEDLHLALLDDGTVHMWQSLFNAGSGSLSVLQGLEPSPFNLRAPTP